jgi:hypothetical protein
MRRPTVVPNFENAPLPELEVAMKSAPKHHLGLRIRAIWSLGRGIDRDTVALFCNVAPACAGQESR